MSAPVKVTKYRIFGQRDVKTPRLKIALFADLHACEPFVGLARTEDLVAQTNALGADLILLLGDYPGHIRGARAIDVDAISQRLAGLSAPLGVFAIFGNHDWRDDPIAQAAKAKTTLWHHAFERAGIATLSNQVIKLETPEVALNLAGLESQRAFQTFWHRLGRGADDLPAILEQIDPKSFTILMAHEPDIFPDLPPHIDLTVSGHTHGGQIVPFGRPLIVPSKYGRKYAYGHHKEGSRQLVVSGGLGYSGLPVRFGCPPELVMLELE